MKESSATDFASGAAEVEAPAAASRSAGPGPRVATAPAPERFAGQNRLTSLRAPLMIGGVVLVLLVGAVAYFTGGRYEGTDDAYVRVAGVDVSSNIAGRVVEVDVRENQRVRAGQVLFKLDPIPYDIAIETARAQVADSRLQVTADLAGYREKQAALSNAQDSATFRERERKREQGLLAAGAVSQSEYDQAAHEADAARLQVTAAQQQLAASLANLGGNTGEALETRPNLREARSQLARAELQKSWTVVHAPQDGKVTKVDQLQVGDYINAATPVFHLVADRTWVEAAFKENQLHHMRPGQVATIKIDAYPDYRCSGRVESLAPGTDQTFSMMPAENATGNWVKVVQRLPVRLSVACQPAVELPGGISAQVKVDTGYSRSLFGGGKTR